MKTLSQGQLPALSQLMASLGVGQYFSGNATVMGDDPVIQSPHRLGEAAASALLLDAVLASAIWEYRTGQRNDLQIDMRDALHFLHPTHFIWQSGYNMAVRPDTVPINSLYRCNDGRQVWLQSGPPYPKLNSAYLNFFNCGNNREAIASAIARWNSADLEQKLTQHGLPCSIVRTTDEWRQHPQGQALLSEPVIEIEKIAEGPVVPFTVDPATPLSGLKVLDLTHVLAGPRSTMTLAEFGAQVLHVSSPYHSDPKAINLSVNAGKKSSFLDLRSKEDYATMKTLLSQADVFAQSYRASVVENFSLSADEACALNPNGLVYLSINAYGHKGPWKYRPGFDQNAQMVSGFAVTEGSFEQPKTSPVYYLNDLLTGYFAAAGMMAASLRRATEGGSYHVKVSLARSCLWVQDLGLFTPDAYLAAPMRDQFPQRFSDDANAYTYFPHFRHDASPYGVITSLAPAVQFSQMPALNLAPVVPFGSSAATF